MQQLDKPLKKAKQVKPRLPSPTISEPIDRYLTEEEVNAPIPSDQQVIFLGDKRNYNHDSNAKTITVQADGVVVYQY